MYKKILILSLLLSTGCTDSYKKVTDVERSDYLAMNTFVDRLSKKLVDLDIQVRADKNLVRFNNIDANSSYFFLPDQHWLDIKVSKYPDTDSWNEFVVSSKYPNDYKASKEEALKYCRNLLKLVNPNFDEVFERLSKEFEASSKGQEYNSLLKTEGLYLIVLDGVPFETGAPFVCSVTQSR
ncbi:hypothetical protein F993_01839 [Acinetobacter proteolyticus]|jgi:hypothetical protein|uniref:Lipoprotein n=1 Tax=Acinetobacter proteolyticus TaxID=1776741 RepID=A0A653K218_9GAMM|nr:hypothetical protein [Acinetobacter proteolyticus]ENU23686.1 hypothetical protein F993_01839 [Acinetobacter proteolyticus]OEY95731.1 hypothetical protein BJD20_14570 [Acinetobacter proteolyticus]PKF33149.1 hypothetical protein CW311_10010 [Acinetobacter proteolyticus]VXA54784.1 conserved hypothetical protein [Acinetobacter proteolyticus]